MAVGAAHSALCTTMRVASLWVPAMTAKDLGCNDHDGASLCKLCCLQYALPTPRGSAANRSCNRCRQNSLCHYGITRPAAERHATPKGVMTGLGRPTDPALWDTPGGPLVGLEVSWSWSSWGPPSDQLALDREGILIPLFANDLPLLVEGDDVDRLPCHPLTIAMKTAPFTP